MALIIGIVVFCICVCCEKYQMNVKTYKHIEEMRNTKIDWDAWMERDRKKYGDSIITKEYLEQIEWLKRFNNNKHNG